MLYQIILEWISKCILTEINYIFENLEICLFFNDFSYISISLTCVVLFFVFSRTRKDAHWNFAKICPIFSPWTPIWYHFIHFWMMSVPKQPGLKLKSVQRQLLPPRALRHVSSLGRKNGSLLFPTRFILVPLLSSGSQPLRLTKVGVSF